jgi:hypothetical protein
MGARWYNPATGSFGNKDTVSNKPVPNSASASPFGYAADNPLGVTDPTGHATLDAHQLHLAHLAHLAALAKQAPAVSAAAAKIPPYCATGLSMSNLGTCMQAVYSAAGGLPNGTGYNKSVATQALKVIASQQAAAVKAAAKKTVTPKTSPTFTLGIVTLAKSKFPHASEMQQLFQQTLKKVNKQYLGMDASEADILALYYTCAANVKLCGGRLLLQSGLDAAALLGGTPIGSVIAENPDLMKDGASERVDIATSMVAEEDGSLLTKEFGGVSCVGSSFTSGTLVLLATGKAVPIASLKIGDMVLATNTRTGKTSAEAVAAVEVNHDHDLYNLKVKTPHGVQVIHTTANHLFWDPVKRKWIKAGNLAKGEHLKTAGGQSATADGGTIPKVHDGWMWDLTIPGNNDHDFYVILSAETSITALNAEHVVAADTAVLVHNIACTKPVNLPAWKSVNIDMEEHILPRHTVTGAIYQQSGIKDAFPADMSPSQIESTIRQAYRMSSVAGPSQGSRVFLRGSANGLTIEMWVNKATKTIETAYPVRG